MCPSRNLLLIFLLVACQSKVPPPINNSFNSEPDSVVIRSVNEVPNGDKLIAIQNVTLIDGTGSDPVTDMVVIVEENLIKEIGNAQTVSIPDNAEIIPGEGLFLLPGLIDAHFHLDGNSKFPHLFLKNGVTSVRDPGAWIESYQTVRESGEQIPRLFLTGPHLDQPPPAYPQNSYLVRDGIEAKEVVNRFADQGASAIKVYFRLPPEIIEVVCETAHQRGIPVTAHLEATSATAAVRAGIDGIEHITSVGIDLLPQFEAEQYRQSVLADNNARRLGRYQVWDQVDLNSYRVDSLLYLLKAQGTVVSPTLGAFEHQLSTQPLDDQPISTEIDSLKARAFKQMQLFTGLVYQAGIPVVVGSHSWVPYQKEVGWAYQREMELLSQCGLTNEEIIQAATLENAKFLRIEQRLGTVEVGKQADLLLLEEDPLQDLGAFYQISRVMLNGQWVE